MVRTGGKSRGAADAKLPEPPMVVTNVEADVPTFYANNAQLVSTPWDLRINFGELTGPPQDGMLPLRNPVSVVMSWAHAKALVSVLAANLSNYEASFGEIRIGPKASDTTPERG